MRDEKFTQDFLSRHPSELQDLLDDPEVEKKFTQSINQTKEILNFLDQNNFYEALETIPALLKQDPLNPLSLNLGAFTSFAAEQFVLCQQYTHRMRKNPFCRELALFFNCLLLAKQEKWALAQSGLKNLQITHERNLKEKFLFPTEFIYRLIIPWIRKILAWKVPTILAKSHISLHPAVAVKMQSTIKTSDGKTSDAPPSEGNILHSIPISLPISFHLDTLQSPALLSPSDGTQNDLEAFFFHYRIQECSLLKGFDTLLCLSQIQGLTHFDYQVETVRKVLKQFRGRVLLADEVGLGKTIEAGLILKEYLLRGMVKRILILCPSPLVTQWQEEMQNKFGEIFSTSAEGLLRKNPEEFWNQNKIIASFSQARSPQNAEFLPKIPFDMVIVDEAHHLKNRRTKNWEMVDSLQKRFLLLLSATPIQNNLIELYNILTLLKPGIFKTEKDFREAYLTPGKPKIPLHPEQLQALMREVTIRNTRAMVNVRLPPRQALTLIAEPTEKEFDAYQELSSTIKTFCENHDSGSSMAYHHFLSSAGSSPKAVAASLLRYSLKQGSPWTELHEKFRSLPPNKKMLILHKLIQEHRDKKMVVFVHYLETLDMLDSFLESHGIHFTRFDGSLSRAQKDKAIQQFRDEVPILLCTESGGEGRNLQFASVLVNYDLPWNPQKIEQRIGRLHRIGQTQTVLIYNLVTRNTLEEYLLKVLDEKINMFELVVGEIQSILGELEEEKDFEHLVFTQWISSREETRETAFDFLSEKIMHAKKQHDSAKAYDEELFGQEFESL